MVNASIPGWWIVFSRCIKFRWMVLSVIYYRKNNQISFHSSLMLGFCSITLEEKRKYRFYWNFANFLKKLLCPRVYKPKLSNFWVWTPNIGIPHEASNPGETLAIKIWASSPVLWCSLPSPICSLTLCIRQSKHQRVVHSKVPLLCNRENPSWSSCTTGAIQALNAKNQKVNLMDYGFE